ILPRGMTPCIVKNSTACGDDLYYATCVENLSAVLERRNAGENAKVVNKMRLVEVSAVRGEPRPIHRQSFFNATQQCVESPHPAKQFWCQANLLSKQLNEPGVAESGGQ